SMFFFSSRRRHTRFSRDWSSDVCSSDLQVAVRTYAITNTNLANYFFKYHTIQRAATQDSILRYARAAKSAYEPFDRNYDILANRSGERRVGKDVRSRWLQCLNTKKLVRE